MEGYFPGFSAGLGTRPGERVHSEQYLVSPSSLLLPSSQVSFEGVACEHPAMSAKPAMAEAVRQRFEACYDWRQVMGLLLDSLAGYSSTPGWEAAVAAELAAWLGEAQGWGLAFTLLSAGAQQYFLLLYSRLSSALPQAANSELFLRSPQSPASSLLMMCSRSRQLWEAETRTTFTSLLPDLRVDLLDLVEGPLEHQRRKMLFLTFTSCRLQLVAMFTVFRKRLRRSLVEVAGEVVGMVTTDPALLAIPRELRHVVMDKMIDATWVGEYLAEKHLSLEEEWGEVEEVGRSTVL